MLAGYNSKNLQIVSSNVHQFVSFSLCLLTVTEYKIHVGFSCHVKNSHVNNDQFLLQWNEFVFQVGKTCKSLLWNIWKLIKYIPTNNFLMLCYVCIHTISWQQMALNAVSSGSWQSPWVKSQTSGIPQKWSNQSWRQAGPQTFFPRASNLARHRHEV